MKKWTKAIEINAPIEHVWKYLDGSVENMQKIMPQVIEQKPVKITEEVVGSIYRQKFKEGKRTEEYDIETLEYTNEADEKKVKVGFILAKMFEITALYELNKINDTKTSLTYTVTTRPLKWYLKFLLIFATDKTVVEFLERFKKVAEAESGRYT
ncbi:SRPBCC family protein [Peribacillus muralis]|uniref:SRPBCC family protein n=1 Tax=Peribacillus muralis TaxID=264697 RepID=UPI001F4EB23D|nr:SRPBCC family protein [Peribacillus muralis]MCK1992181.1 SRPBCC family protein [Peribacillus muralis]MCK2012737.1 SRPBCC family protein [Peribacillus muralis]